MGSSEGSSMLLDYNTPQKLETQNKKPKRAPKRKNSTILNAKLTLSPEQNNNIKRQRVSINNKDDMLEIYQPWVIQTYGDLAKTKTITLRKYSRILKTLRGEEAVSADNSKFRFWVKAKGFHVGQPEGYEPKPADAIIGRYSVCDIDQSIAGNNDKIDDLKDPVLYVPNAPFKNSTGKPVYRKVAVVENFFDIIYTVHVELEGRPGKHAGQKRTYRTITETYAFLPREAVTRFLLGCTECQKHPRSPSPLVPVLPTPSPSPTLSLLPQRHQHTSPAISPTPPIVVVHNTQGSELTYLDLSKSCRTSSNIVDNGHDLAGNVTKIDEAANTPVKKPSPLDVCNLMSKDRPCTPVFDKNEIFNNTPKLWSPVESIKRENDNVTKRSITCPDVNFLPITTTYLKYMRTLGCSDEDAFKFENKQIASNEIISISNIGMLAQRNGLFVQHV